MLRQFIVLSIALSGSTMALACPSGLTKHSDHAGRTVCQFKSNDVLNQTVTLTPEFDYILVKQPGANNVDLSGTYIGGDNAQRSRLTILPGVKIYGNEGTFLSISRGSDIRAVGTQQKPIVFTASKPDQTRGLWGGLIINGNAPVNSPEVDAICNGVVFEGVKERTVCFGGKSPSESSGVLKYVRVEYGGYPIAVDKEINGFTFNGVGDGTIAEFLQAHMIADDCFEFFGGNINLRNLVCTGSDDDGIDSDFGFTGRIQYALIQYAQDKGDNGFEWDNHPKNPNATPRTMPMISNATVIGGAKSGYGMLLRKGTSGILMNSIFTGFTKACIDIDDKETFDHNSISISNTVMSCAKNFEEEAGDPILIGSWFKAISSNSETNPNLDGYVLRDGSPLQTAGMTPDDLFFDEVKFIGAVRSKSEDWTSGWTVKLP